jgi:hypothetical protein
MTDPLYRWYDGRYLEVSGVEEDVTAQRFRITRGQDFFMSGQPPKNFVDW